MVKKLIPYNWWGIIENTHRVLDPGQDITIDWSAWEWQKFLK